MNADQIKRVTDFMPTPIEALKANWGVYAVTVELRDGTFRDGSMQGDTHRWAFETFVEE